MNPVFRAVIYIKDMKGRAALGLLCAALVGMVATGNAKIVQILIDDVLAHGNWEKLNICILLIMGIQVSKGLLLFGTRYTMQQVGHTASQRLRSDLFDKIQRLPLQYFHRNHSGQIISRMTGDVLVLQDCLAILARTINDVFQVIFGVALMFWIQFKLAAMTFLILPVLSQVVGVINGKMKTVGNLMQSRIGDIASATQEAVIGIKEIQSFGLESDNLARFAAINADNYRVNMKATKYNAISQPIVELFHAIGMGLVVWYGSVAVIGKSISPGELLEFLACLGMIFHPIKVLTDVANHVKKSEAAAVRIFEVLDEPVVIQSSPGAPVLPQLEGRVELRDVSFSYQDRSNPVVRGVSLSIEPGQVVALVGHSGAGKTTLVNLLPRFYDVTGGAVLVDGHDVREVDLASLRRHIGLVPQETILFSGTVGENIALGRPGASSEQIRRAADDANALEFVDRMPQGFDTPIGERGIKLSGGEKQRIAIARALLKDPRVLILDEATSNLDSKSEALVQEALERLMSGRTTLVIAHRLSTVTRADKIVVMEAGEVREVGTHDQLLRLQGIYHGLCRAQFKAA